MKRKKIAIYSLIALICLFNSLSAQKSSDREKAIFENNLSFYTQGDFAQAEQNFALVITKLPKSASYLH